MKNKRFVLLSNATLIALFSGALYFNSHTTSSSARTERNETAPTRAASQWEHCAVSIISPGYDTKFGKATTKIIIRYFLASGAREEPVEGTGKSDFDYEGALLDAYSKAIAKLGNEGWEMVQEREDSKGRRTTHFKRSR